jgi:pimeloyl-ACP methyl ester carboxylesterase
MSARDDELVVLLHGLGRSAWSLKRLEWRLQGAGYRTRNLDYPSRRHGIAELVQLLQRRIAEAAQGASRVHFVGHSLGAVLLRGVLARPQPYAIGRVVMLAPPNAGVSLLERSEMRRIARFIYGRPVLELAPGSSALAALPGLAVETGVIAGSARFHPFNPTAYWNALLRPRAPDHDGTVDVDSTRLPGMADFVVLPVNHSFMPDHPEIARQVMAFLDDGAFARTAA